MMKEKNLLYILTLMFFLILSAVSILLVESRLKQRQGDLNWEMEKVIGQFYRVFTNDRGSVAEHLNKNSEILSLGFYNFYGQGLFYYGDVPRTRNRRETDSLKFNRKQQSVTISRDILSPFSMLNDRYNLVEKGLTDLDKQKKIRYVIIETKDSMLKYNITRFRIAQILVITLALMVSLFFISIYKKNMRYRKHIDSTERLVVLGTAARTLTHEIKNPLSIIRLQSAILRRIDSGKSENSLLIIDEEVERITSLTERITDFLRQPIGNPERIDINKTIINFMALKAPDVTVTIPEDNYFIKMDRNRFSSIIDNLVNNAVESGSATKDITITVEPQDKNILFNISDKGRGISKESIKNLFDPFYTTKSKGSGLGLSIVASFIQATGGNIEVTSELNVGTTVMFTLPQDSVIRT